MQSRAITKFPRDERQDGPQSALAYWGTGLGGIAVMLVICFFAGLRL